MQSKIWLRKTSLVDYPGRISAVFFFQGCNLRCPWCHNRELVLDSLPNTSLDEGLAHLRKRSLSLSGVVLSGGEPCLQEALPEIIGEIKKIPLPVKLDTNGMFPAMLEKLFSHEKYRPDYIALDLKISPARYSGLLAAGSCTDPAASCTDPAARLTESANLIRKAGITHNYRTLALPGGYISEKDIEELAPLVDLSPWHFRPFIGGNCLDPSWDALEESAGDSSARTVALAKKARELGKNAMPWPTSHGAKNFA